MRLNRREALVTAGVLLSGYAIKEGYQNFSESQEIFQVVLEKIRDSERKRKAIIAAASFPDANDFKLADQIVKATGHPNACESQFALAVEPVKLPPSCEVIAQQRAADTKVKEELESSGVNAEVHSYQLLNGESNTKMIFGLTEGVVGSAGIVCAAVYSKALKRVYSAGKKLIFK